MEKNTTPVMEKLEINGKKCYSCGKTFKQLRDLQRHQNRKTPCLIREVSEEHINNPLRCIFCNKVFTQKQHLIRHLGICKIKNGGINILDEKIRYEQEIRILKEQRETDSQRMDRLEKIEKEKDLHIKMLMDRLEKLENNQNVVSNSYNTTINPVFNFYNYDKPKLDTLTITPDDLLTENITKKLIELIYFNKDIPENHSIYRPNLKEQRLLVHKNNLWENIIGEEIANIFNNIKNTAYMTGYDKINSGVIYKTDDDFLKLYPVIQNAIKQFNVGEKISDDDIMNIATKHRDLIKATMLINPM